MCLFIGHQQSEQTDCTAAGPGEVPRRSRRAAYPNSLEHYCGVIAGI